MCPQREQSRSQETHVLAVDLALTKAMVTFLLSGLQFPNLGNKRVGMDDLYDHFQLSQPMMCCLYLHAICINLLLEPLVSSLE